MGMMMMIGTNLEILWGAFHFAAVVLLPYKLHTSRSAEGVSLKMQELYLLVYLMRIGIDAAVYFGMSAYEMTMTIAKIALTAITIGMMRCRPSLRASYDVSLDHFRSWAHGIIPALVLTIVIWASECSLGGEDVCWFGDPFTMVVFLRIFSEVLEPFAIVPQLLVLRGCTDAGRLTGVYISLMGAYRALFLLHGIISFYIYGFGGEEEGSSTYIYVEEEKKEVSGSSGTDTLFSSTTFSSSGYHLLEFIVSTIQTATLVVFLVDWRLRVSRCSPPDETGGLMELNSAARELLLPDQEGTDDYSGDDASASSFGISGSGAVCDEARSSCRRQQGIEIVDRIEATLLRERGQGQPPLPYGTAAAAAAAAATPEGRIRSGSGEDYLV